MKVAVEGNQIIDMDPTVADIFLNSTSVSTTNGRSYNMLKIGSKRRRSKAQIEADKASGKASASETMEAINKLNKRIAEQEAESKKQAEEAAKHKAEMLKLKKLEKDIILAKVQADKGKEANNEIQSLLQSGVLMYNEAGKLVPFSQNVTIRRANPQ